jgi:hypothetical protein
VRHLPTSHSLFLSRPAELAEMIGEITEASVDPRRPSGDPPAERRSTSMAGDNVGQLAVRLAPDPASWPQDG